MGCLLRVERTPRYDTNRPYSEKITKNFVMTMITCVIMHLGEENQAYVEDVSSMVL